MRQAADGRHPERDSGVPGLVVHRKRHRSGTDADRPPQRQAIVHAQTQIGMEPGQCRGHLVRDIVERDRTAAPAVGQRDAEEHPACRQIRTDRGGPNTAAQDTCVFALNVESGKRAPAPEAPSRRVLLRRGRAVEGTPRRNHAKRGARAAPARRRVVRHPFQRPADSSAPHPLVECIHHLSRHRTAEELEPFRIIVRDGRGRPAVCQCGIARIAQPDGEGLVVLVLVLVVVGHLDRDRLPRVAGLERQHTIGCRVVRAGTRRPVRRLVRHGHPRGALFAQPYGEHRAPVPLGHRHVVDRQRRQWGGGGPSPSLSTIVALPSASSNVAFWGLLRITANVSFSSSTLSSRTDTAIVLLVSPD